MKLIFSILLLSLTSFSQAANLELVFNETSFSTNTSGTFRLTGIVPAHGFGSAGSWPGGVYVNDYHTFSTQLDTPTGALFANNFTFNLNGYGSTGNAIRNSVTQPTSNLGLTHPAYDIGITMWISKSSNLATIQVFLQDQPNPNFDLNNAPLGDFVVDLNGSFSAMASAGAGVAPDSLGMSFGNLAGTYVNQFTPGTPAHALTMTVTNVPEPSTASLIGLAAIPLFFRRRKIS